MTVARFDAKPFCPCDADRPQDCEPEDWPGAHKPRHCLECGVPSWAHSYRQKIETPDGDVFVLMCKPESAAS